MIMEAIAVAALSVIAGIGAGAGMFAFFWFATGIGPSEITARIRRPR